jgi:hypothetical protein
MSSSTRINNIEVCLNDEEKGGAIALCKVLGIGLSTWYRGLGNEEIQRHRTPPAPPRESRGCRGARPASRASAGLMRRQV